MSVAPNFWEQPLEKKLEGMEEIIFKPEGKSPYNVLQEHFHGLVEKLDTNYEVSTFLNNVLHSFIGVLSAFHKDPRTLRLRYTAEVDAPGVSPRLKIFMDYTSSVGGFLRLEEKRLWERNPTVVMLMEVNSDVRGMAARVVGILEQWAAPRKIPFSDIRIPKAIMVKGGGARKTIVAEITYESPIIKPEVTIVGG